jgi:hypothetical protein
VIAEDGDNEIPTNGFTTTRGVLKDFLGLREVDHRQLVLVFPDVFNANVVVLDYLAEVF